MLDSRRKALLGANAVRELYAVVGGAFVDAQKAEQAQKLFFVCLQRNPYFSRFKHISIGFLPEKDSLFKNSQISVTEASIEENLVPQEEMTLHNPFYVFYFDPNLGVYVAVVRGTMATKDLKHSTGKDGLFGAFGNYGHDDLVDIESYMGIPWPGKIKRSTADMLMQKTDDDESLLEQWKRQLGYCEKGKVLYLNGHSLGAAVAQIYAVIAILYGQFEAVHSNIYGAFPIFDQVAADAFNKESRIICNNFQYETDPVPLMKNLATALVYRYFLSLQMVQEYQKNDQSKLTKHVGKIWYGNFAIAHDGVPVGAHKIDSYMDGFLTPEMWAAWKEFHQTEGMITVIRSSNDEAREEAVKEAEKQALK